MLNNGFNLVTEYISIHESQKEEVLWYICAEIGLLSSKPELDSCHCLGFLSFSNIGVPDGGFGLQHPPPPPPPHTHTPFFHSDSFEIWFYWFNFSLSFFVSCFGLEVKIFFFSLVSLFEYEAWRVPPKGGGGGGALICPCSARHYNHIAG